MMGIGHMLFIYVGDVTILTLVAPLSARIMKMKANSIPQKIDYVRHAVQSHKLYVQIWSTDHSMCGSVGIAADLLLLFVMGIHISAIVVMIETQNVYEMETNNPWKVYPVLERHVHIPRQRDVPNTQMDQI